MKKVLQINDRNRTKNCKNYNKRKKILKNNLKILKKKMSKI